MIENIPEEFTNFVLVTLFALIIGLAQRRLHPSNEEFKPFGTDRTFTFIGILGYILCMITPLQYDLFLGGGLAIIIFLSIYYYFRLVNFKVYGITTIVIGILTYCLAPLIITQPKWLFMLVVVTILIFTELKESFGEMSKQFDKYEFLTLGKFLVIAGVILPIIPDQQFISFINITPYRVWLAVVVISTISYISYLLKKFVFKDSGIIISGILGGLYSSTATTIILSKKSRTSSCHENQYAGAIILATCMMYIRILILLFIFNKQLFLNLFLSLLILAVISAVVALIIIRKKPLKKIEKDNIEADKNPLEFKVALLFTALYVAFSFVTWYAVENFGENGLTILSFIVGVTDIDPFLINIFQGKYSVSESILTLATIQAIISNNVVKVVYATFVSSKKVIKPVLIGFAVIIAANIIIEFFL
ncbi:MAG TPA: DUF4010 domain-containing protein [Bacteroidales bacterium]|nr:DUF4010 domain-containing protein [Bacteroidales bacterium]HQI46029.1 DUF4010 domain-containing protein [Bacteroidales bacterium]